MLANAVIPIVNENDTISVTELMFTDNDELSGLIATMLGVDRLILLSNIDGIYNGSPSDPNASVIRQITREEQDDVSAYIQTGRSSFGRGGMLTKCTIARKVAAEGIEVIIANGKKADILTDLLTPGSTTICTRFVPASKPVSSVKKWIAHSEGFAKGEIYINQGAEKALSSSQATSLLLVASPRSKEILRRTTSSVSSMKAVVPWASAVPITAAKKPVPLSGTGTGNRLSTTIICI